MLSVLALLACALPAAAQVSTFYSFAQSAGSLSVITGGTRLNTTNNSFDDQVYTVTIPEFFYDGSYYTTMYVSANGFITFGAAPAGNNYTPLSSNAGYAGAISPFGTNIRQTGSGTREVRWQQVGSEIVVQWAGARRYDSGTSESFTVQARLHTVTGVIRFVYSAVSSLATGTHDQPQVGLRGPNNTFATNVNNRMVTNATGGGANNWATSLVGTANSSSSRFTNTNPAKSPTAGLTYTWTPVCLSPAANATVSTNCATNTYTITVDVTSLGSAANVTIQSPIGTNVHTAVGTGTYSIGPINVGTSRTVRVVHTGNSACNIDLGTLSSDISACVTNGNCLSNPYLAIPDNGCGSNNAANAGIQIAGLNNSLGSSVDLLSVDLIMAHTNRGDLRVTLTSPTGQTRNLILNRGGTGDNFGNPGSCPTSTFTLSDDAANAVSASGTGNNPVGSWRPEQTLAGFTGDPNGTWTVTICDGTNGTTGTLRYVKLNFCDRPVITATTSNSPICSADQLTLGVTASGAGLTYAWTGTGTFSPNATSADVSVSGAATGTYSVTVSNGCTNVVADIPVVVNPSPTDATANSSAASVCSDANTVDLTGSGISPGTILSQNFNAGIAPWTTTNTSTGGTPANAAWTARANNYTFNAYDGNVTFSSNDATQFVLSNSDAQGSGTTATTLVSPSFSTVGYTTATLSYYHYYRYNSGADDRARVEVSVNGGGWTTLETYSSVQGTPTGFVQGTVSLNGYLGQANLQVRFRYNASWDYFWAIDNVEVTGTSAAHSTFAWTSTPSGFTSSLQNPTGVAVTQNTTYTLTVTAPNGCTATANTAVTHTQAPAATIAYTGSPYCAVAGNVNVAHTGTTGGTYTSTAGLSINASTGVIDAAASTNGTYTVTYTVAASGPCAQFQTTASVTITDCIYYSRNTGTLADPIWSLTPNGAAGYAVWNDATAMVVQTGDVVTNGSNEQVGGITVQSGGSLVLGAFTLTSGGDVAVQGALTANDNSALVIAGNGARTLSLAAATSFWDLTCNTPDGTTLTGNASIRNTLLLQDGEFDCTGNPVALESNAISTGRLGPVGANASYTGNLTVNRYIPAGATNWRMLGSPVAGRTVNHWKDDFTTAGFPGSHYPSFDNPVGSGIVWPSIRWYDETNTGADMNDGLVGATSTAQPLAQGQGFAAWCGTGLTTTTAFTVDVTGNPHIAHTPISLPMSYTNTGVPDTDGWNMVSNPLASPIAFDQISRGADVADYITYFNPANGNLATWDISEGLGTNGGTNVIQSSQAFWLKATGTAVTTTVSESAKVSGNSGGFFGGAQVQTASLVRLRIQSAINQYSDETVVLFSSGEPEITGRDVPKFIFAHPDAPQIGTQGDAGQLIAINAFGPYTTDISIPVKVDVAVNGSYTIVANEFQNIGLSCLSLVDLATNTVTPLADGATYTFTALTSDNAAPARFVLRATAPMPLAATAATCHGSDDGSASVEVGSGPVDITWTNAQGGVILEQTDVLPGTSDLAALPAGSYGVRVAGDGACGALSTTFVIGEPDALEAEAITLPSTCPDSEDGTIGLTVLGGVAPYTYLWSNEATTGDIEVATGSYTVLITDANGCTFAPQEYVVGSGEGPDAGISVEGTLVLVGEDILFTPNTIEGVANTWDFGDGSTSNDLEALHSYAVPGSYTITLSVDNGDCISTASIVVDVQTGTGVPTVAGHSLNAYVSGDHIVVDHDFGTQHPVIIRVLSTSGQLAQEHRVANAPARITLPANDLASGVWLVRVSSGEQMRTFSLPIVH